MSAHPDVLIVGGGIIGLAIAREAARAGLAVDLLERGEPGGEASRAAAGMLSAQVGFDHEDPAGRLGLLSRALYDDFVRAVREESGVDPGLQDEGTILLARSPGEAGALERLASFQRAAGLAATSIGSDDLRRLEPGLAGSFVAGVLLPLDVSLDCPRLLLGLRRAAESAGARVRPATRVDRLLAEEGRVVGVEANGDRRFAGTVVVAAGAWSGGLAGEGVPPIPASPVRGQIVCLGHPGTPLRRILFWGHRYLVPRGDGRILAGSTMENAGFDRSVTAEGARGLIEAAGEMVPALRGARIRGAWAGLRPAGGDERPAIGPGPAAGLAYACGHLRHGVLHAPITARLMTRMLTGGPPEIDMAPFDPRRFTSSSASSAAAPGNRPSGAP